MANKSRRLQAEVKKQTKLKRARNNRNGRPRKLPARRIIMPRNPPQYDYATPLVDVVIRARFDKKLTVNTVDRSEIDIYTIINKTCWQSVVAQFDEIKVVKMHFWTKSNCDTNAGGSAVIAITPDETTMTVYDLIVDLPGSMERNIGSIVSAAWRPTEPTDRLWFSTSPTDDQSMSKLHSKIMFYYGTDNSNLTGEIRITITIDIHVKLRGFVGVKTLAAQSRFESEPNEFVMA